MDIPEQVSVKYESPYQPDSNYYDISQQLEMKRRYPDQTQDMASKRQRVDTPASPVGSIELAAFLAQATACATQQLLSPSTEQQKYPLVHQTEDHCGHSETIHQPYENDFTLDPQLYMQILSLPILESLSVQILSILARGPYHETIKIVTTPESELGKAYALLKSLFDQTKKIYSPHSSFLSVSALNVVGAEHRATIRRANLATFISSVFCGYDVGFLELNDHFIDTFTAENSPLEKEPGMLFLNLKTQMYLSAVSQEEQERTREDILEDFFPNDLDELLRNRQTNRSLSESEENFLQSYVTRRELLANAPVDLDSIQSLSETFSWEDFLKQIAIYLEKESPLGPFMERHSLLVPKAAPKEDNNLHQSLTHIEDDIVVQAELAAKQTLESLGLGVSPKLNYGSPKEYQYHEQNETFQPDYSSISLPKEQTAPTQVLYERARQAAVARASPSSTRRPGLPSQRRPWSGEEERALMAGLDQVKGPHWSQILALYGSRGTINEVLKDRNQVQLKDKARNLKLFFLKSGIEVPYYLKTVTGELKTRAPTQAAKREAEERARLASAEEQIRMNGIMALTEALDERELVQPRFRSRENSCCSQDSVRLGVIGFDGIMGSAKMLQDDSRQTFASTDDPMTTEINEHISSTDCVEFK
ncbi:unnamed protein product [Blumeria hordei]|uniref:Telomere repeat-binding factor dimerisation domain-containing protein n=1 Tax=Blumeria hordei TaxID=2867405 RepID=A0A383UYI9_BLUHO|nr:unnamed protein product [Blumeria hordei]